MNDNELKIGQQYSKDMGVSKFKLDNDKPKLPDFKNLTTTIPNYNDILRRSSNCYKEIEPLPVADHMEKTEEYHRQSIEILKNISENTANLKTLVNLISQSNENQDIILEILQETLTIAKAKDKEEADALYKGVVSKINDGVTTAESMGKIITWATILYDIVKNGLL